MVLNFLKGGAAINAFARAGGIELTIVDAGVASPIEPGERLIRRRVANGTRNFCLYPAMDESQMFTALDAGIEMAHAAADAGCDVVGFGEMGIGNTTCASAITAALTGKAVTDVVGPGTGADADCLARKRSAIDRALARHTEHFNSPLGILQCLGGFEIAAMTGFCWGAAARRVPVLTDGFIATAAAAVAVRACPSTVDYLFAAHQSSEPGHAHLLELLGLRPLLNLDMRLGEGTGAALAIKIVQASIAAFTGMATFTSAGVSNR
jgi:nicotinate-nucleotide--dimethylbenzimidazole phosphoribosyltransferase